MDTWASRSLEGTAGPGRAVQDDPQGPRSCSCFLELLSTRKMPFHSQLKFQLMEEKL